MKKQCFRKVFQGFFEEKKTKFYGLGKLDFIRTEKSGKIFLIVQL